MNSTVKTALLWVVIIVLVFLLWSLFQTTKGTSDQIAFSKFMELVNQGTVETVTIRGEEIRGETKANVPGGKNVYLVKDVIATGVIENYLLTQLRQKEPAALKLVALIDRPSQRTVDLKADFRAFEADDGDGAFVGYGLEIDGRFGNLRSIARVNPTA